MLENINEINRSIWIKKTLFLIPKGLRVLDAGAGELKNKKYCSHLDYVSQDFCQYQGDNERVKEGLHSKTWDTESVDIVSDIVNIPVPDASFDVVLCSEVLEHIPEPTHALAEFQRILKPKGIMIITAPFSSNVHMAPHYYCSGFSKYWYKYHLSELGFEIRELTANGDWFSLLQQEITRLGGLERQKGNWSWPLAYFYALLGLLYFKIRTQKKLKI